MPYIWKPKHAGKKDGEWIKVWFGEKTPDCEILIKSFHRFNCLERLVKSIRWFYPSLPIAVADDSNLKIISGEDSKKVKAVKSMPRIKWIQLPFDTGLAEGRNELVRASEKEYVLMCDDDFVFTDETRIGKFLDILKNDKAVNLIAGAVRMDGKKARYWSGDFRRKGNKIMIEPSSSPWKVQGSAPYRRTELVFNFFAARREFLLNNLWDKQWKAGYEHLDYFLTLKEKNENGVYFTPSVAVGHLHEGGGFYDQKRYRWEKEKYKKIFCRKWKIDGCPSRPQSYVNFDEKLTPEGVYPNTVLLGVGHSNTTVTAKQLAALGWNLGDADEEYAESVSVRALNSQILKNGGENHCEKTIKVLEKFPQPWIIKDPRFAKGALPYWLKAFEPYRPALLWLVKDMGEVKRSYEKRGEDPSKIHIWLKNCEEYYENWPWHKIKIGVKQIEKACSMLKLNL